MIQLQNWIKKAYKFNVPVLSPRLAGIVAGEGRWAYACFEVPLEAAALGNSPLISRVRKRPF